MGWERQSKTRLLFRVVSAATSSQAQATRPSSHLLLAFDDHSQKRPSGPPQSLLDWLMPALRAWSVPPSPPAARPPFPGSGEAPAGGSAGLVLPAHAGPSPQHHADRWAGQRQQSPPRWEGQELCLSAEEGSASRARKVSLVCKARGLPFALVAQTDPLVFHPRARGRVGDLKASRVLRWTVEEYTAVFDCTVEGL